MAARKQSQANNIFKIIGLLSIIVLVVLIGLKGKDTLDLSGRVSAELSITPSPAPSPDSMSMLLVTADPSLPSPTPGPQLLKNGSAGDDVKALQERLALLGYYNGSLDGQFGNGTRDAVILFQAQHGLDADGIAGPATMEALNSESAQVYIPTPSPSPSPTPRPFDPTQWPILINSQNPLPSGFTPGDLVYLKDECPSDLVTIKGSEIQGEREAVNALNIMLRAAHEDGLTVWQVSAGYRTVEYQQKLFDDQVYAYRTQDGLSKEKAISATKLTVAEPGMSEHHTGLAFDMTVPGKFFKDTEQSKWLAQNCWDYGFIIRYQEEKRNITGILAEPWHIRYVGIEHSIVIRDNAWCLEEYIDYLNQN